MTLSVTDSDLKGPDRLGRRDDPAPFLHASADASIAALLLTCEGIQLDPLVSAVHTDPKEIRFS